MMRSIRSQCLLATAGALALWSNTAFAQQRDTQEKFPEEATDDGLPDRTANYLDLTASIGYSTNPHLRIFDSEGSAFGRASARGVHSWRGELSSTSIAGFVEGSTYFNKYGFESIFAVDANHTQRVSERVSIFGSAGVSGDLAGQLSNRFLSTAPPAVDPTLPPPPVVTDPNSFTFSGHQYRFYGQGGASIQTSERGTLTLSAGAQHLMYTNDFLDDYTTVFGTASYNHTLSERTTIGFSVSGEHTEYKNSSDSSTIISPTVNITTQLSQYWTASGGVGVSFTNVDRGGDSSSSTDLALHGSLCRTTEQERLCANVQRYSQSSGIASIVTSTQAGVDWYRKLDASQTIQLSAGYTHYVQDDVLGDQIKSNYFRAAASYDRRFNERFSVGGEINARAFHQTGPDADNDYGGTLFLRYRLGDLG